MNVLVATPGASRSWPAAVSPLVAAVVHGPPCRRRVLGVFATCVYVELGRHDRVLAVHTPDAVQLPIGLRLAEAARLSDTVCPGDLVTVGDGRVRLPGAVVVSVRRTRPGRVEPGGGSAWRACQSLRGMVPRAGPRPDPDGLDALAYRLCSAAVAGGSVRADVDRLVGAGRGLTPSGDDLLCGILLALRAFARSTDGALVSVRGAVLSRLGRTTSISAALLSAAAQGWAAPDVVRLLALLGGCVPAHGTELPAVWARVRSIGHTSGADLLAGVTATLAALAGPACDTMPLDAYPGHWEAVGA